MMRAILIDDEKPALLQLERLLLADGRVEITGKYTTAREGLDHLTSTETDVVFLDISMPEMNGLESARYIQLIAPDVRIVYITAFSEYALEAFELYAIDYVLKPVHPARLGKTLDRLHQHFMNKLSLKSVYALQPNVLCFGRMQFVLEGDSDKRMKWRTLKALELFACLLHNSGQWMTRDVLLDTIWPLLDAEKAVTHLHTSVYQVRKLLKERGIEPTVLFEQESYSLGGPNLQTDADLFEQKLKEHPVITEHNLDLMESVAELYRGDYLQEYDYAWAKPRRKRLLEQYVSLMQRISEYDLNAGRNRKALQRLSMLQEKDPYSEEVCCLLLEAYARLNDYVSLRHHYKAFVNGLQLELGIDPEPSTHQLYVKLLRGSVTSIGSE